MRIPQLRTPLRRLFAAFLALALAGVATLSLQAEDTERKADRTDPIHILFLGDSLTAGYGLSLGPDEAYPAFLGEALTGAGHDVLIRNAGLSGDTSAGGARRLAWILREPPDLVVVALGANDALRGLDPASTQENLRRIIETIRARAPATRILLAGMLAPPNLGESYGREFGTIYPALAAETGVPLIPFLLEGVAGEPRLNQSDGIHPTAEGQRRIAAHVLPFLQALLEEKASESP